MAQDVLDVFLSYQRDDRTAVRGIKGLLEAGGVRCFMDEDNLGAGLPWQEALERALKRAHAVVVALGPGGLGHWQRREVALALDRQANEERAGASFPVIPVLLPGSDATTGFLFSNTWIDLREGSSHRDGIMILLKAVRGNVPAETESTRAAICPYKGLRFFREDDARLYFGRKAYAQRLREAVNKQRVTAVIGPSGSGKSSLVYAGLLPLLRKERPPAASWDFVCFTPGDQPYLRLASALMPFFAEQHSEVDRLIEARKLATALSDGTLLPGDVVGRLQAKGRSFDRLLVVCDQFEELLTLAPADVRTGFVDCLFGMMRASACILFTLRADYYGHVIELHRDLSDHLEKGVINLGPMNADELREVICGPAQQVGLEFDAGLVDRLLSDVGSEPGGLALLEFTLTELWERRQGLRLVAAAYEALGCVSGSIATRAEAEYHKLAPEQQAIARSVLTQLVLVSPDAASASDSRQRANLGDFEPAAQKLIAALTEARLLVTGRVAMDGIETVEVAHEALIRHWHRLRAWVDENREFLLWRQRLVANHAVWQDTGHDAGSLLRGAVLTEAERWRGERAGELDARQVAFIDASIAEREDNLARQVRRQRQVVTSLVLGICVVAAVAVFAGLQSRNAQAQRALAQEQRNVALSGELAAKAPALIDEAFDRSLLLSVEAANISPTFAARSALFKSLGAHPHLMQYLRGHVSTLYPGARARRTKALAFHPNAMILAAIDGADSALVHLWEWRDGKPSVQTLTALKGRAGGVCFGGNGKILAAFDYEGGVAIWDVASRRLLRQLDTKAELDSLACSPNGQTLALVGQAGVQLLGVPDGSMAVVVPPASDRYHLYDAAFSPDGQTLAVAADTSIEVLQLSSGARRVLTYPTRMNQGFHVVAFHPDGKRLVSRANDAIHFWDTNSWTQVGEALPSVPASVDPVAFSPDGKLLATDMNEKTGQGAVIRSLSSPKSKDQPLPYPVGFEALAFSADGRYMAGYHDDGAITIWSVSEPRALGAEKIKVEEGGDQYIFATTTGRVLIANILSDEILVSESGRGEIFSASLASTSSGSTLINPSPAFSQTGRWLAVVVGKKLRLFDLDARIEKAIGLDFGAVSAVAFSPAAPIVAVGNSGGKIVLYDFISESLRGAPISGPAAEITALKFSDAGVVLASASVDGEVRLWNSTSGKAATPPLRRGPPEVNGFSFSRDGSRLAAGGIEGFAIWSALDGSLIKSFNSGSTMGSPRIVSLSPDGALLASSLFVNSGLEIWDGKGTEKLGPGLVHRNTGAAFTMAFDIRGKTLLTVQNNQLMEWDLDLDSWRSRACKIANRSLTEDEWQRYLGDLPYRPACANLGQNVLATR